RLEFILEGREKIERLFAIAADWNVLVQLRACSEILPECIPDILRREDGEACDERTRLARQSVVVGSSEVQACQHFAGRSGVFHRSKRSPRDRVLVQVGAFWNSVYFVS